MHDSRRTTKKLGEQDNPLRDQIRDELRERICDGRLAPGERLVEQVLANEFGVSRVPVREALTQLVAEGIVMTLPRRGAFVQTLTRDDLENLFAIREALEVLAFRLAAERATDSDVATLRSILGQAAEATASGDHSVITRFNTEFHEAVIDMAANPYLRTMLEPLMGRLRVMIGQSHAHDWQLTEHTALADAIAAHDAETAAKAALSHVRESRERALQNYAVRTAASTA